MSSGTRPLSEVGAWEMNWVLFWSYIKITSLVIGVRAPPRLAPR